MLSSTLKAENSAPCWNSMPTRLAAPCSLIACATGWPSTLNAAFGGRLQPQDLAQQRTVLPVPEPPTRDSTSPRSMARSRFAVDHELVASGVLNTVHRPLDVHHLAGCQSPRPGWTGSRSDWLSMSDAKAAEAPSGGSELHGAAVRGGYRMLDSDVAETCNGEQRVDQDHQR